MSSDRVLAAVAALRAIHDELDAYDLDTLTADDAVTLLDALQDAERRTAAHRHRALTNCNSRPRPSTWAPRTGARSWPPDGGSPVARPGSA
ncbi:hypothetical protein [Mycolicibacterium sp. 050158]|uniref:hypothetical protein n=1 Tax=Mycolicibacterium sp. 050158 TaxID=3090602 RepID=UPI00299EF793|nr:hypothetical protein [Mycolicibacterium sp. 050158]MDX1888523.1 hypothetical protein [Mycolicibacterium sp. 050158]